MKYTFAIFILLLGFADVKAQNDLQAQNFIKAVIPDFVKQNRSKRIIYSDNIYSIDDIKKALDRDILRVFGSKWSGSDTTITIVFSKEERLFVQSEINKMKTPIWKDGLLDDSRMISRDTINSIFKDNKKGWSYFYEKYHDGFYSFSKPIFIRNSSICFFYRDYSCGSLCASGELAIYVNKNGKWIKMGILYSMIS